MMKKKLLSILPAKNILVATQFKVSVQGRLIPNHVHRIKDVEIPSNGGGTQIFPGHRNESKNETTPAMKNEIAVMAFRSSSSGHSPQGGHDNRPDRIF